MSSPSRVGGRVAVGRPTRTESLLDIVDHVLTKGVVITGEVMLGVADIDLIYLRLSAVLCSADRILGPSQGSAKHRARLTRRRD